MKIDEKIVAEYMKKYDCTREDAVSIIMDDYDTDHMDMKALNAELTDEQKKAVKDARKTGKRAYTFTKRERKPDEEKAEIIAKIAEFLAKNANYCVEIIKKEGEIALKVGENEYSVNLVKHRTAKK